MSTAPVNVRFSTTVARKMSDERLSLRELARRTGIPRSTLRGRIAERRGPWYVNDLDLLARAFDMDLVAFTIEVEEGDWLSRLT